MKKMVFIVFIVLFIFAGKKFNKIEIITEYYKLHKFIFDTPFFKVEFPDNFNIILSKSYLKKEKKWFEDNYKNEVTQLINQKNYYLSHSKIENIKEFDKYVIVNINTIHPEYFYTKKTDTDKLLEKYKCNKSDIDCILKIDNKLKKMWEEGLIIGKGWYPKFKTIELHKFIFNKFNEIDDIQIEIISGKLTETYDEVINSFIELNKKLKDDQIN